MRYPLYLALALLFVLPGDAEAKRKKARHNRARQHQHVRHRPPAQRPVRYRPAAPGAQWRWSGGYYRGGRWVSKRYVYHGAPPLSGYMYVPGYWRGSVWISAFWRPPARVGYVWVDEAVTPESGELVAGYWEPEGEAPEGEIWRPGYWDGRTWVEGQWVTSNTTTVYDEDGELSFFAVGDGHVEEYSLPEGAPVPLALSAYEDAEPEVVTYPEYDGPDLELEESWDLQESVEGSEVRHHSAP